MLHRPIIFRSADGSTDFTINNRVAANNSFTVSPYWYISVTDVDGMRSSDISTESVPLPNATGEKSGDIFRRGKGISLSGTIEARSFGDMENAVDYLEEMFWDTSARKFIWYPFNSSAQIYVVARVVNDVSIPLSKDTGGQMIWRWAVGLRADDPRFYKLSDDTIFKTWQT